MEKYKKPLLSDYDWESMRQFASAVQANYVDAILEYKTLGKAAEALGVEKSSVYRSLMTLKLSSAKRGVAPEYDMTHGVPDGFLVKGVSTFYNGDGTISRQWVKSDVDKERRIQLMQEIIDQILEPIVPQAPIKAPKDEGEKKLCNLLIFTDYHMGQLSWRKEGGADWDLKIAETTLLNAFRNLLSRAPVADTCIVCLQGDFLHTDGLLPLTPGHKNVLDADGRFSKIVAVAIKVIRQIINEALLLHKNVHLIIAEGNHDEAGSMWLRQMFAALYDKDPRLTVNNSELPYYVYQHGEIMLAFHHGHKMSNEQLPMLFAAQYPSMWGATKKRYAHTGHRHHTDEKEYSGMLVTQHPTLAARDAHTSRGGWISERATCCITYHQVYGQVSKTIVCPEMFD